MMLCTDGSCQVQHAESVSGAKGVSVVQANVAHMVRNAQVMSTAASAYCQFRNAAFSETVRRSENREGGSEPHTEKRTCFPQSVLIQLESIFPLQY